jgi:hypothetical protein
VADRQNGQAERCGNFTRRAGSILLAQVVADSLTSAAHAALAYLPAMSRRWICPDAEAGRTRGVAFGT